MRSNFIFFNFANHISETIRTKRHLKIYLPFYISIITIVAIFLVNLIKNK